MNFLNIWPLMAMIEIGASFLHDQHIKYFEKFFFHFSLFSQKQNLKHKPWTHFLLILLSKRPKSLIYEQNGQLQPAVPHPVLSIYLHPDLELQSSWLFMSHQSLAVKVWFFFFLCTVSSITNQMEAIKWLCACIVITLDCLVKVSRNQ